MDYLQYSQGISDDVAGMGDNLNRAMTTQLIALLLLPSCMFGGASSVTDIGF